jgi:hypothetical protein
MKYIIISLLIIVGVLAYLLYEEKYITPTLTTLTTAPSEIPSYDYKYDSNDSTENNEEITNQINLSVSNDTDDQMAESDFIINDKKSYVNVKTQSLNHEELDNIFQIKDYESFILELAVNQTELEFNRYNAIQES